MTNKELLYLEDALNHLKHFDCVCEEASSFITDDALIKFTDDVKSYLTSIYNNLYQTLSK